MSETSQPPPSLPSDETQVEELLLRWQEQVTAGQSPSIQEICAGREELIDELARRIAALRSMDSLLAENTLASDETAHDEDIPLPNIPGYRVQSVLGRGGMGVVFAAEQLELRRVVALKTVAGFVGQRQLTRFRAEAEIIAGLKHPQIVQIYQVGTAAGRPFYAMELIEGTNLSARIREAEFSPRDAAQLTCLLARAIHVAHEQGVIHRDLKPANVLLDQHGTPKITDFGVSKRMDSDADHTRTGEILGTICYMAPEQAAGARVGPPADVYSLGAILYELLTGRPLLAGRNPLEMLEQLRSVEPLPPSRLRPVPRDLEAVCLKCLEKRPEDRYQTAAQLAEDLEHFLESRPVAARQGGILDRSYKWSRRHWRWVLPVLAVTLALCVILVTISEQHRRQLLDDRRIKTAARTAAPQVREILVRNCLECHGEHSDQLAGGLDVLDYPRLLETSRRIVVPGSPDDSRLIQRIADGSMPPEEEEQRLPRVSGLELTILRDWIAGGAPPIPPADPRQPLSPVVPRSALAADVKQLFLEHCYECHRFTEARGGIKILHHRLLVEVRKVVVPNDPEGSELMHLLVRRDERRMPPPGHDPLAPGDVELVRRWIEAGALPFPKGE